MLDPKKEIMSKENEIKVDHPEFGHVIFHGITPRQKDVLESLKKTCLLAENVIAQNKMLAAIIKDKDKQIEKLKSAGDSPYIDYLT